MHQNASQIPQATRNTSFSSSSSCGHPEDLQIVKEKEINKCFRTFIEKESTLVEKKKHQER